MQIKDVMQETQLSKKAIRYYENCGLIETSRKSNGYKDYSDESVHKLASVKKFRELGFSTEEIKDFFESDSKRQAVLTEKLTSNDKNLATQKKIKEILTDLRAGKPIEQTDTSDIDTGRETPYMLIKNVNLLLGVISLVSFVLIFTYFIFLREPRHNNTGWLFLALSVVLSFISKIEGDRKKRRVQGVQDLERKPKEMLFRYLFFLIVFVMGGAGVNDCLAAVNMYREMGESYGVLTNSGMGIAISLFSLGAALLSFFEDTGDVVRLFKKPANK